MISNAVPCDVECAREATDGHGMVFWVSWRMQKAVGCGSLFRGKEGVERYSEAMYCPLFRLFQVDTSSPAPFNSIQTS